MFTQENYQKALHFAGLVHGDQKYPGKPYTYLVHTSMVAMEIMAASINGINNDEDNSTNINWDLAVQCAILHDTLEDTETTYEELENEFGQEIADGVLALTKNKDMEKSLQMEDSLKRIKDQPKEIWLVKLADRITNLQKPPEYWEVEKVVRYREEAKTIYKNLKGVNEYLEVRLLKKITEYINYINIG